MSGIGAIGGQGAGRRALCAAAAALAVALGPSAAQEAGAPAPDAAGGASAESVSLARRLLFYVPNRLLDFTDIFRARLRLGPGLAAGARVTDYAAFYGGGYRTVYLGLPGPRYAGGPRAPAGRESLTGLVLFGVDATDDTPHGPRYAPTEVGVGAQALLLGADFSVDPLELADFLAGFALRDIGGDDWPRPPAGLPARRPDWGVIGWGRGTRANAAKPAAFATWGQRLDYLYTNVTLRTSESVRLVDELLAASPDERLPVPDTRIRLGLYAQFLQNGGLDASFEPDLEVDVDLPNIERRLRLFIENVRTDELPGRPRAELESRGVVFGLRRLFDDWNLSADAGVRPRWYPEAFARVRWHPTWIVDRWRLQPEQRLFAETGEGLGTRSSLFVDRWFGPGQCAVVRSVSALRWTTRGEDWEWEQSLGLAYVCAMIDEADRAVRSNWDDVANGAGLQYTCFGRDTTIVQHRVSLGFRRPLYRHWLFWQAAPGLQWDQADDFDVGYRFDIGIDAAFWGGGR